MKIIIRIKANIGKKVVFIAGNTLNTKVIHCTQDAKFTQIQTEP
jgi:hypothetical protein